MYVRVAHATGECVGEYSTPAGVGLERYLPAQYPGYELVPDFWYGNLDVTVYDSDGNFVETHCGGPTYKKIDI
jgi:hypothetical protein